MQIKMFRYVFSKRSETAFLFRNQLKLLTLFSKKCIFMLYNI